MNPDFLLHPNDSYITYSNGEFLREKMTHSEDMTVKKSKIRVKFSFFSFKNLKK